MPPHRGTLRKEGAPAFCLSWYLADHLPQKVCCKLRIAQSLRGAKRRGNPYSPVEKAAENGFPRHQCAHWFLGMTGLKTLSSIILWIIFGRGAKPNARYDCGQSQGMPLFFCAFTSNGENLIDGEAFQADLGIDSTALVYPAGNRKYPEGIHQESHVNPLRYTERMRSFPNHPISGKRRRATLPLPDVVKKSRSRELAPLFLFPTYHILVSHPSEGPSAYARCA